MMRDHIAYSGRLSLLGAALIMLLGTASAVGAPQGDPAPEGQFSTLILSPEPGEVVPQTTSLISLSFIDPAGELDVTSVRLLLDGSDVTADATVSGEVLVYIPRGALRRGLHSVVVTARARDGSGLPTTSWSFATGPPPEGISPETERRPPEEREGLPAWARLNGNVIVEGAVHSIGGEGADLRRQAPAEAKAWVNLGGRLGGSWRYDFYSHLNSYESRIRQPINRFRFNLRSSWLTVGAGDVTPRLQELMLWGRRVRGLSMDVRGGPVNLAVVSGQSRRAVTPFVAPLTDTTGTVWRRGTFAQDLFALRPYFGSGQKMQFGLTFMHVRDDVGSLDPLRATNASGTTTNANPLPKDNLVAGLDFLLRAFDGRFSISYNNALSLYANDITSGPLTASQLDSVLADYDSELPFDFDPADWENLFIFNASMIPIDPSSMNNLAHLVRASLQLGGHTLGVRWRNLGGSYYSMAQPSLQRDRAGLRVQDSFRLFDDQLGVTVGWEQYNDNLDGSKSVTTDNSALTLDVMWQSDPAAPGFMAGYRGFGRSNDLQTLSAGGIDENTTTYSLGGFMPVGSIRGLRTQLNINFTRMGREDALNPQTENTNSYYLISLRGRSMDRTDDYVLTYGINTLDQMIATGPSTFESSETTFHRLQLRGRRAFSSSWYGTADLLLTQAGTRSAYGLDYGKQEIFGGAEYHWTRASRASLRAGFINYKDGLRTGVDTSELAIRLRLTQGF
ncbi:MAG: hypothetical protein R6W82_05400 [bacterium]